LWTNTLGHSPLGGTNLGGYLYYNHPALHVFMRTHSLMIYTPTGHDCFSGRRARAKGTGVYVFFWEPESTMGYGKLIDFTASIAHSFCSYHFHFLILFHFISLCPLFLCLPFLMDAMITTSRRDFVFVPYRSQHRVASIVTIMYAGI